MKNRFNVGDYVAYRCVPGHVFEITYINRITANLRIEDEVKNDDR